MTDLNQIPNMVTRKLGMEDCEALRNIYNSQKSHMTVDMEDYSDAHMDDALVNEYLNPEVTKKVMFGTFINGQLALAMGIYYWDYLPMCTFSRFASLQGFFTAREIRMPFRSLYGACLDAIEEREYYRFYILTSARHHEMLAYLGGTWDRFKLKYLMTVEEVIPANTKPKFEYAWFMMGYKVWPTPLIIRAGTLLNKYRKIDFDVVSEKALKIWDDTGQE